MSTLYEAIAVPVHHLVAGFQVGCDAACRVVTSNPERDTILSMFLLLSVCVTHSFSYMHIMFIYQQSKTAASR